MKAKSLLIYSVISGLLMVLAWPAIGDLSSLIFVAWVPLLLLERKISESNTEGKKLKVFYYSFLTFFIWNLGTCWWIYNASPGGMVFAIVANSFFMALIFLIFHVTSSRYGRIGYLALIIYWLGFEYLHHHWEFSWPWLTIGNVFAGNIEWVQWYEFTGVMGGSLWVLTVNVLIARLVLAIINNRFKIVNPIIISVLLLVPISISFWQYSNYSEKNDPVNIVIVQPNIDPYHEKFGSMSEEQQLLQMLKLAADKIDDSTEYVICPETALPRGLWERGIESSGSVRSIMSFLRTTPNIKFITGLSSQKLFEPGEKLSATARKLGNSNKHYDAYNSAMQLQLNEKIQLYHKSRLVLGVEDMPFHWLNWILERFIIDLGGTMGSLGTQEERTVFFSEAGDKGVAPVICYESVYGEYIGDYVNNGAEMIFIVTNDGWWGDTPGYRQHLSYARLRAVETRRSIARSANTGTSCFINQRGDVFDETSWWKPTSIKGTMNANDTITFYTRYGDYIGRIAIYMSVLLLLYTIVLFLQGKQNALTR